MSEYEWFWDNYEKSMEWINHHEVAFWKSQAIALKTENTYLKDSINKTQKAKGVHVKGSKRKRRTVFRSRKRRLKASKRSKQRQQTEQASTEFDVKVSPELMEFFKISAKHKEQWKKEKEEREALTSFIPPQAIVDARIKEMKSLYGEGSCKIIELEKTMTLNFEKFVDRKCPEYWPELALNLNPTV